MFLIAVSLLAFAVLVVNAGLVFAVPALVFISLLASEHFSIGRAAAAERRPAAVLLCGVCQIARHPGAHDCGVGIMDILNGIMLGMNAALSWTNLASCFFGVFVGTAIGILPGLGPLATIAMLLPPHLLPRAGDRPDHDCRHLLRCPIRRLDHRHSRQSPRKVSRLIVTCLDGRQMALKGRAGAAFAIAALGIVLPGTVATLLIAASHQPSPGRVLVRPSSILR